MGLLAADRTLGSFGIPICEIQPGDVQIAANGAANVERPIAARVLKGNKTHACSLTGKGYIVLANATGEIVEIMQSYDEAAIDLQ